MRRLPEVPLLLFLWLFAALGTLPAVAADDAGTVELHFFWSARCPHCLEARPHVTQWPAQMPWLRLHDLEVGRSPENARRYVALAAELGQRASSVPAFVFCGELHVGWRDDASTGAMLRERLAQCRERLLTGRPAAQAPAEIDLPIAGRVATGSLSLPLFTLVIAGLDAFNPCAFFVLLFLLGLLAHQRDRRRMLLIGGTFVAVSGLVYFAFMAAWLNLFQMLGSVQWVTAGAAVVAILMAAVNIKDYFAFKRGPSLTIPPSRLPGLYRRGRAVVAAGSLPAMLGATLLLALAANAYELLCTAGFPMVYTRVLTLHDLPPAAWYGYLALYNLVYVLPLAVIVTLVTRTLARRQLTEYEGRLLKLLSGAMMLGLGLVLLLAPQALASLWTAVALLAAAVGATALVAALDRRAA
jgi:hypothetical protein